jgi:hypothetical protein
MLVDRIVQNFRNAVMESSLIGATDVHARLFPDRFQTLQGADLGTIVGFLRRSVIGHNEVSGLLPAMKPQDRFLSQ